MRKLCQLCCGLVSCVGFDFVLLSVLTDLQNVKSYARLSEEKADSYAAFAPFSSNVLGHILI